MRSLTRTSLACLFLLGWGTHAAEAPATNQPAPAVRNIGPGIFQIGLVRVDANTRELSFPAQVNMREGQVEYIAVSAIGKLHESIFKTDAEPYHIHTGALLLTGKPSIAKPATVQVRVEIDGRSEPPSSFVYHTGKKALMEPSPWQYSGSRTSERIFLAQRDGSIISIITDPDALVENLNPDREKDEIWEPHASALPAVGQPVQITIKFPQEKPE